MRSDGGDSLSVLYLFDYVECCGDPNCLCSEAKGRLSLSPPLSLSLSLSLSLTDTHTPSLSLYSSLSLSHSHTHTHTHTHTSQLYLNNPFMIYYSSLTTTTAAAGDSAHGQSATRHLFQMTPTTNTSLPPPPPRLMKFRDLFCFIIFFFKWGTESIYIPMRCAWKYCIVYYCKEIWCCCCCWWTPAPLRIKTHHTHHTVKSNICIFLCTIILIITDNVKLKKRKEYHIHILV